MIKLTDLTLCQRAVILSGIQNIGIYHLFPVTVVDSRIFVS